MVCWASSYCKSLIRVQCFDDDDDDDDFSNSCGSLAHSGEFSAERVPKLVKRYDKYLSYMAIMLNDSWKP